MRAFEPGDVLKERYSIDRQIGAGGMGSVYLASHLKLEMPVAVKTCHLGLNVAPADRPDYMRRFKREARALMKLKHTNIIGVLDYDVAEDTPFLVMEYFKGLSALAWGEQHKPTARQWLSVFRPLFEALAVAHRVGIVHRDIKAPNVLVRGGADAPEVMLIDWGVAFDPNLSGLTQQGAVVGSPGSIDPARYVGAPYTPQSDIYSLGALMYWALTAEPPIVPKAGQNKHEANAENRIVPPHELNPAISGDLEEFLVAMLETNPDNRPPSALACVAIIGALENGTEVDWEGIYARFPKRPFVPAADLEDVAEPAPAPPAGGTKRLEPTAREGKGEGAGANEVDIALSQAGEVKIDAPLDPKKKESPAARLDKNLGRMGVTAPRARRWMKMGVAAAAFVAFVATLALIMKRPPPASGDIPPQDSTLGALVTPDDIERATKAAPPALEQVIEAKKGDVPAGNERLDQFKSDIRARYGTKAGNSSESAAKAKKSTDVAPAAAEPQQLTLGIVHQPSAPPAKSDGEKGREQQLTIPHGTRVTAFLVDLLDTSSAEPVRAELRSSLRVDDKVVIPVGSVLIGASSFKDELRASASFTRVILRDGREFPIRAVAVLKDGREGIAGGQFEYGDSSKKGEGGRIVGEVAGEAALDIASMVLPGADALSRTGKNAISRESSKVRDKKDDTPRKRDRMIVTRGTELIIQFMAM
ncbi:MAG: protein kinase [Deltaproteobacteria bacterium]|nr:protein kinase [Deltaproteobacteria bacterium]